MNKTLIWIIVIVVILIIGFFIFNSTDSDSDSGVDDSNPDPDGGPDGTGDEGLSPLTTDDDIFNEIDNVLEFLE